MNFGHGSRSEVISGELVSDNYFQALGVVPALGRAFLPEEGRTPGTHPVVVLSTPAFGNASSPAIHTSSARTIVLNNYRFTVVGVAPADFTGVTIPFTTNLWLADNDGGANKADVSHQA